jgi:hypothetical protein
MGDQAMARVLARLDKLGGGAESPWPDQIAAHLSIDPMLTDETLAGRFNVSAALVARVRANVAAGRQAGRGIDHDAAYPAHEPSQPVPGPADTPEPGAVVSRASVRNGSNPCDIAALMPRYRLVSATGETHRGLTYGEARVLRHRVGGKLTVEGP